MRASSSTGAGSAGHNRDDAGFTLVELVVACVIMPLIIGAIAAAFIAVLSLHTGVNSSFSDSADAQALSANYELDVQSAVQLTTSDNTLGQCGPASATQLLGLEWTPDQATPPNYQTVVSYDKVQNGTTSTYSLVRYYCAAGPSTTPTISSTLSSDIPAAQPVPVIAPPIYIGQAGNGWTPTGNITGVTFSITEPQSNYPYTLVADPTATGTNQQSQISTGQSCGFATPGTGIGTICFVDFSSWNKQIQAFSGCPTGSLAMASGITGTSFSIQFCLNVQSWPNGSPASLITTGGGINGIIADPLPTYASPPTSEAYLGNNGFYSGVPGAPALYQSGVGTTSLLSFTNIQVLDSSGKPASNWGLVTGDAESTDHNESITWSTCPTTMITYATTPTQSGSFSTYPNTGSAGCAGPPLTLIPNSSTSPYGNACHAPILGSYFAVDLSGIGTNTVECAATVDSDKTGTVMLQAVAPTTLTAKMVGDGLQAIFLGVLLP